jgi:superfamily II DNA/RNA helicase
MKMSNPNEAFDHRCMVVYGGTDIRFQATQLQRGVHVLIATPGKLEHFEHFECFLSYLIKNLILRVYYDTTDH